VQGMTLGAKDGVGQGGACFANSLMGRCSRLPWRHLHLCSVLFYYYYLPLKEMLFSKGPRCWAMLYCRDVSTGV